MTIDDFEDYLDGDPEFNETVDGMFRRLRRADIISLTYYRYQAVTYLGWKPMPLHEYAEMLRQKKVDWLREQERKKSNTRVMRENRLHPIKPKKD